MKYFTSKAFALFAAALIGGAVFAQEGKQKSPDKDKDKLNQYDEIIIKKKSDDDKNKKVTIEINDGVVTVNGKPLAEFKDDDLSIRRKKVIIHGEGGDFAFTVPPGGSNSPFRIQRDFRFNFEDENKGFLGVQSEKVDGGVKIAEVVPGSAAEKAGLKVGDIITKVDNVVINTPEDLSKTIGSYKPEEKVTITYKRNNKEQRVTTELSKRKVENVYRYNVPEGAFDLNLDGLDALRGLGDMKPFMYRGGGGVRLGIKAQDMEEGKGVKVLNVEDSSNAAKAGIKEGDIITACDGKMIANTDELINATRAARDKSSISVKVNRDGKIHNLEVKIPKKLKTATL